MQKNKVKNHYEKLIERIQAKIESGQFEPGEKLPSVVALAEHYGVGRSTMREALTALKAMGWLDIRHGGGTFVSTTIPVPNTAISLFNQADSVQEVLEVRKVLESEAARLSASRRTEENLAKLDEVLAKMRQAVNDEAASEQADIAFHLEIARATQNKALYQLMASMSNHLQATMRDTRRLWFYGQSAEATKLWQEHQAIFEAVKLSEPQSAAQRMRDHLERVETTLLDL